MGMIKLLHCAPWRIGEPLTLPADCWIEQPKVDADGPVLDENGEPVIHYGIRYWGQKVQRWDIKWLPTAMVPVAKEAINTIISLTQGARDLAKWYEEHPGQAWLPGPDLGPFQEYTMEQVAGMFGLASEGGARQWLATRQIPINRDRAEHTVYRSDLEPVLLEAWHKTDYLEKGSGNIKRSNLLFLTFANQHNFRNTNPCCIAPTTDQHISDFLSGRGDEESGKIQSIFERFESVDAQGKAFIEKKTFVEPSIGAGMFLFSLLRSLADFGLGPDEISKIRFMGVDLNRRALDFVAAQMEELEVAFDIQFHGVTLEHANFLDWVASRPIADVAFVGNPPFVTNERGSRWKNLYADFLESMIFNGNSAGIGLILPVSVCFSRDFVELRRIIRDAALPLSASSYDNMPDYLFKAGKPESGNTNKANSQRCTILNLGGPREGVVESSALLRWSSGQPASACR